MTEWEKWELEDEFQGKVAEDVIWFFGFVIAAITFDYCDVFEYTMDIKFSGPAAIVGFGVVTISCIVARYAAFRKALNKRDNQNDS